MSNKHWWRAYEEALDDPKLLLLSDRAHRAWFNLMCLASIGGGRLPERKVIDLKLRLSASKVQKVLNELIEAGLIDKDETGMEPHNWNGRQYKSDVSTDRVKRFRERERNVSETPPETENRIQIQKDSEANASGADAPRDIRSDLFDKGLKTLAKITGKTPDSCRSLVGRWLKSVNDEAVHVLGAIEDAERNRVADPVAWINRALAPRGKTDGQNPNRNGLARALAGLREHVGELDRGEERGQPPHRLLSHG